MKRGRSVGALVAACVLLAGLLVWIEGRTSTPSVGGDTRLTDTDPIEKPAVSILATENGTSERAAAEDTRENEPSPTHLSSARLSVLVVSRSTRNPLSSIRVCVWAKGDEDSDLEYAEDTRGGLGLAPITGDEGRVEFDLPSYTPFRLSTSTTWGDASSASLDVTSLQPGEKREILVELVTEDDLHLCGIVLTRAGRRPIAGAHVRVQYPRLARAPAEATSDAEGRFEIQIASWKGFHLRIDAAGFGPALVVPGPGHETPGTEFVVLLEQAATLEFHLTGAGGLAVAGVRFWAGTEGRHVVQPDAVSPMTSFYLPRPDWSAETDARGRCSIEDLPAGVPLTVEVTRNGAVLRRESNPMTLRPGEVRELEWRIGAGCRLIGHVVDQANVPVVDQELWILRPESTLPQFLNGFAERRVAKKTTTDREGVYVVEDLAAGRWCVGPPPSLEPASDGTIAPLAAFVEIPEGAAEIRRDLQLHRGLYIRGRVVDPSGAPIAQAAVLGSSEESAIPPSARVLEDGTFAFGPLVPGRYVLYAAGHEYGDSDRVEASAGDEGVVLQLESGGALIGTVMDARTGVPCPARLTVTSSDEDTALMMLAETNADGAFRIGGLKGGAYDIAAYTEDTRVGCVRSAQVSGRVDPGGIEIRVVPGAKLRISYEGKAMYGTFQVSSDGLVVGVDSLENGASKTQGAPVGRVTVKFTLWDPTRTQERTLDLVVGEEREIVFTEGG